MIIKFTALRAALEPLREINPKVINLTLETLNVIGGLVVDL
jgi:hypothetical protein